MTQIPAAAAADLGILAASPPVALAAGVQAVAPYPTKAPQALTWAQVNNSSPFTVQVSQGQLLGQVAAFTVDVFPVRTGAPLGLLPVAGAGVVSPGSDSTAYVTWYQAQPGGSFPSALGSGAVTLQNTLQTSIPSTLLAIGAGLSTSFGPFSTVGFGGLTLSVQCDDTTHPGPLIVSVGWYQDLAGTLSLGLGDSFLVAPASVALGTGVLQVNLAHMGPFVKVTVTNLNGVQVNGHIVMSQTTVPAPRFAGVGVSGSSALIDYQGGPVAAGATVTLGQTQLCYGGPAMLFLAASDTPSFTPPTFTFLLQPMASNGAFVQNNGVWDQSNIPKRGLAIPLLLGPMPYRVRFTNPSATNAGNPLCLLVADTFRVGG